MERRHSTQFVSRLSLKWPNERRHDITTIAATGRERTAMVTCGRAAVAPSPLLPESDYGKWSRCGRADD
jgi:hypothetical protein